MSKKKDCEWESAAPARPCGHSFTMMWPRGFKKWEIENMKRSAAQKPRPRCGKEKEG